jgi:putative nucleotidyltransferase with HDIG domain
MIEEIPSRNLGHLPTKRGTEFIVTFYQLLKGATLYNRKNILIESLTQECLQVINKFVNSEGYLSLRIVRDNFFFNHVRIQVNADQYSALRGFLHEMRNRWIGELEFRDEVNEEQLKDFVYFLSDLEENNEDNYLSILKQLEYRGISTIQVGKFERIKDEEIPVDFKQRKQKSKEVYFRCIHLIKDLVEGVKDQRMLNVRKAKRLMQDAVHVIMQDEAALLGLANIKNYDEYIFNHSVNVAIYAIAIGQRIGIPPKYLSHLGMAGLFHDIGKVKIPKEVLIKSEKLSPEELAIMRFHPIFGAEILMKMKEWDELSMRMITVAFEHHLQYDLTGYPKFTRKSKRPDQGRKPGLFVRIIALADFYDFLVRPMIHNRLPYVSEKIFGFMLERSGKDFDPALIKVFINMIGVFPIGTLVLLNTNEIGIVTQIQGDGAPIDRPEVCLLYYNNGEYQKGKVVDLKEKDETTGEFKRTIVKTLNPNEYHINVGEFFL